MTQVLSGVENVSPRMVEIAAVALRLLEAEGPAAVTMRRIASEMGIRAPSLYKHVADKGVIVGMLQRHAMSDFSRTVGSVSQEPHAVAAAYRAWALANPHLYELAARRPLRRDIVGRLEDQAAAPLVAAAGGDPERARALLGLAHGLVDLELNGRFPPGADIDAAWHSGVSALTASVTSADGPTPS